MCKTYFRTPLLPPPPPPHPWGGGGGTIIIIINNTHCVTLVSPASMGMVGGGICLIAITSCTMQSCCQASLSVCLEAGGGLGKDKTLTHPADILVSNPRGSASAAYGITVTSPLNPSIILEVGVSASKAAEAR